MATASRISSPARGEQTSLTSCHTTTRGTQQYNVQWSRSTQLSPPRLPRRTAPLSSHYRVVSRGPAPPNKAHPPTSPHLAPQTSVDSQGRIDRSLSCRHGEDAQEHRREDHHPSCTPGHVTDVQMFRSIDRGSSDSGHDTPTHHRSTYKAVSIQICDVQRTLQETLTLTLHLHLTLIQNTTLDIFISSSST